MHTKLKIGVLSLSTLLLTNSKDKEMERTMQNPNIIIILADDFGVGNIQKHYPENKISTPYMDQLVSEGMSFTDAHSSSAVCSPTRYGLLTGRYNWRTPLQEWVVACYEPPLIRQERITLPEMLKTHNYSTACIGKWHLGWIWAGEHQSMRMEERNVMYNYNWDFTQPIKASPVEHGFDYYFGDDVINQPPFTFIENDMIMDQPTSKYIFNPDEGVVMPKKFVGSPMAPGWKFDQVLTKITEKAVDYIHTQSKSENPFFLFFSMTSPHEPVVPNDRFRGKSGIAPIADFIMETDWSVGQVLKAVEKAGISENTLIIFTADNGQSDYTGWNNLIKAGHLPSGQFRGHKGTIWEGGHRIPFIVKWKGKIQEGSSSKQLLCLTDIYASINELVSGELPPSNTAEDSFSFLKTLFNNSESSPRSTIVSHSVDGEFAYRNGTWKIVYLMPHKNLNLSRGKPAEVELYNLDKDIAETTDISVQYPEIVKQLTKELQSIVNRGTSRTGPVQRNDVIVRFDTIQELRWGAEIL